MWMFRTVAPPPILQTCMVPGGSGDYTPTVRVINRFHFVLSKNVTSFTNGTAASKISTHFRGVGPPTVESSVSSS